MKNNDYENSLTNLNIIISNSKIYDNKENYFKRANIFFKLNRFDEAKIDCLNSIFYSSLKFNDDNVFKFINSCNLELNKTINNEKKKFKKRYKYEYNFENEEKIIEFEFNPHEHENFESITFINEKYFAHNVTCSKLEIIDISNESYSQKKTKYFEEHDLVSKIFIQNQFIFTSSFSDDFVKSFDFCNFNKNNISFYNSHNYNKKG
jgi:hypothetical protein